MHIGVILLMNNCNCFFQKCPHIFDPGVTVKDFLIFSDVRTGRLFRQFILLPDYYALPMADHTHAIDVAMDDTENTVILSLSILGGGGGYIK